MPLAVNDYSGKMSALKDNGVLVGGVKSPNQVNAYGDFGLTCYSVASMPSYASRATLRSTCMIEIHK